MNGGVSLAVYIGGVAHELNRLTQVASTGQPTSSCGCPCHGSGDGTKYAPLLDLLGYRPPPVVDVITGTSAGGINAAALALAQANSEGDLEMLKNLWIQHGQIGDLLRGPFKSGPPSLLRGDDYFYPQIRSAFRQLTRTYVRSKKRAPGSGYHTSANPQPPPADGPRPIDLTITATLLTPAELHTVDDLGTAMVQPEHAGLFHFRGGFTRSSTDKRPADMFDGSSDAVGEIARTVDALALAARATAGFPVAFEPTFVPVGCQSGCPDDRPDMSDYANWALENTDMSRFAVDGGVLANTPTKPALAAIRRQEVSSTLTRRVLILVHPHATYATSDSQEQPDIAASPPTLIGGLSGVMRASSSVGSKTYVEEIQTHNDAALRSRDGRLATLAQFNAPQLGQFLRSGNKNQPAWELLRAMRRRRAAYVLARGLTRRNRNDVTTPLTKLIEYASDVVASQDGGDGLPFLPSNPPKAEDFALYEWRWGLDLAVGVTTLVTDLLRAVRSNPGAIPEVLRPDVLREAEAAWTVAVNGGVELALIGENERVKPRQDTDETASDGGDIVDKRPESDVIRERLMEIIAQYRARNCPNQRPPGSVESRANERGAVGTVQVSDDATPSGDTEPATDAGVATTAAPEEQSVAGLDGKRIAQIMLDVAAALLKVTNLLDTDAARDLLDGSPQVGNSAMAGAQKPSASLLDNANPLRTENPTGSGSDEVQDLLKRMVEVELVSYLLAEHSVTENEVPTTPIELVQLSAQVRQDFASDLTSDDKLAGMSLNRFGAFLKRSWRANDWMWGRLDAIKILMLILLTPEIVRGLSRSPEAAPNTASATVGLITARAFAAHGSGHGLFDDDHTLKTLNQDAIDQVQRAMDGSDEPLTKLASLAAYGLQMTAAHEDVPWLAETIRDDLEDGASGAETARFLHRFDALNTAQQKPNSPQTGEDFPSYKLLTLFARSGIGQEALADQLPSDLMIRTVATAAATAVTAVSSEQSGVGIARPLTKVARGAIALPYWTLIGLTHRGQLARSLAATVLALGVSLIALRLLADLPGVLAAIVPTIGIASLVTILVYAALRMQSIVHGAALLGLFIPLVSFGVYRWTHQAKGQESPAQGSNGGAVKSVESLLLTDGATLVIITIGLLVLAVVLVANIRTHTRSPMGVILVRFEQAVKFMRRNFVRLLVTLAILLAVCMAAWSFRAEIRPVFSWLKDKLNDGPWNGDVTSGITVALIVVAVVSGLMAYYKSRRFMPVAMTDVKKRRVLSDPAGLATAWAPVYGALYIGLGIAIIPLMGDNPAPWAVTASILSIVFGLGFSVLAVHRIPALRERKLVKRLASYLATNATPADDEAWINAFTKIGDSPAYLFKADTLSWHGKRVRKRALRYQRPAA